MTEIAAVIGSYMGEPHLPECLRSLRAQTDRPV